MSSHVKSDDIHNKVCFFFSLILYPADTKVGRGNLILKHFVLHIPLKEPHKQKYLEIYHFILLFMKSVTCLTTSPLFKSINNIIIGKTCNS